MFSVSFICRATNLEPKWRGGLSFSSLEALERYGFVMEARCNTWQVTTLPSDSKKMAQKVRSWNFHSKKMEGQGAVEHRSGEGDRQRLGLGTGHPKMVDFEGLGLLVIDLEKGRVLMGFRFLWRMFIYLCIYMHIYIARCFKFIVGISYGIFGVLPKGRWPSGLEKSWVWMFVSFWLGGLIFVLVRC